jgi:tetratricopeptide (TPR) repeat protein
MNRLAMLVCFPALLAAQTPEELFELQRYDDARAAFEARLAKNRDDASALYYMGRIADAQGKSGQAADWFEKAVKRDDTNALYHFWLGSALGDEAQKASKFRQPFLARRVKNEFERAVQLDPTMLQPREGLVDFYSIAPGIMGGSMDAAKAQAGEIVKLNAYRGHMALARIAQRQKDVAAEESAYKAAVAAAPDTAAAFYSLAAFYRRQSRWDDAFATYDQLIKTRPDEAFARAGWGFTAAQSGLHLERGEREIKYFFENLPKDVPTQTMAAAHFRLGQIYERTARRDSAKARYAEAVKLNPENQDAKKALQALNK